MKLVLRIFGEVFWLAVAVAVVAGGYFGFQYLGQIREPVEAAPVERPLPLVDTAALASFNGPLPIRGEGFVRAFRTVNIAAQTAGRVTYLHPAIESRGTFEAGDVMLRLDDRTAKASIDQIRANIASSDARLSLNTTQLERAQTLRERGIIPQDQLDQLLTAKTELEAGLESLRANLQSAALALEFTEVTAPFGGKVLSKSADIGSVLNPGQAVAEVYSDQELEVIVPITEAEAALIPGLFSGESATATVSAQFAGTPITWDANVNRVANAVDTQTRTINVAIRLTDPNSGRVGEEASGGLASVPPALINTFAQVTIEGVRRDDLFAVPSTAIHDGNVWLEADGALQMAPVDTVLVDGETAYVTGPALVADANLITSTLATASDGMAVRVTNQQVAAAE
ncbi:MAG: efflux RND transporter periplasmic adaptor subunit [Pseudomonadota bacterium]